VSQSFLYHFHGLAEVDFSEMSEADLPTLETLSEERGLEILPTVYLRRSALEAFESLVTAYGKYRADVPGTRIRGFAVEGPLLGPEGGIPRAGVWAPTVDEWRRLASLGAHGLRYIVIAPDAMELEDEIAPGFTFADLLVSFYDNGCRVALGHFHRDAPERSARRMRSVIDFLHSRYESSPYLILTDHLYNDMPRNFRHAYRTAEEIALRDEELPAIIDRPWSRDVLAHLLGPVPAEMIHAAEEGKLFPCINFDGHHVDMEVARKTVEYLGADKMIALTDHTEIASMAQEPLTDDGWLLWRRDDGKVAAGQSGPDRQRKNMASIGLSEQQIDQMFWDNPRAAIHYSITTR
jgi:N-acetylglucosamine-6-phosphate deacetylase